MSEGGVVGRAHSDRNPPGPAAMREGAAVVHDVHSVVWVRGADAVSFLDALLSQSVAGVAPGGVKRSLLLTPQGKMRAFLWILGSGALEVGLVTQRTTEEVVVGDLNRFRFRVDAAIEVESRQQATLVGTGADDALVDANVPRPGSGWLMTPSGLVAAVPFVGDGPDRYVLVGDAAAAVSARAPQAPHDAYESLRISVGEPAGSVDFDDGTIAHELGPVDAAVDFTKGCYLGQELVARIDSRGRVNQTLRLVHVAEDIDLSGATLDTPDREVGTVTSAAAAPDGTGMIGLARIRHEVPDGTEVTTTINGRTFLVTVHAIAPQHGA